MASRSKSWTAQARRAARDARVRAAAAADARAPDRDDGARRALARCGRVLRGRAPATGCTSITRGRGHRRDERATSSRGSAPARSSARSRSSPICRARRPRAPWAASSCSRSIARCFAKRLASGPRSSACCSASCATGSSNRIARTSELFEPFTDDERRALAQRFEILEVDAGTTLITQGTKADGLYIVMAGKVDVARDGNAIATLLSGDVFGEMSLLAGRGSIASVRTATRVLALRMPAKTFREVIMTYPQVLAYLGGSVVAALAAPAGRRSDRPAHRHALISCKHAGSLRGARRSVWRRWHAVRHPGPMQRRPRPRAMRRRSSIHPRRLRPSAPAPRRAAPQAALADRGGGGGTIVFDCGAAPMTIAITQTITFTKETVLDGGGTVTLDGGNARASSISTATTTRRRRGSPCSGSRSRMARAR